MPERLWKAASYLLGVLSIGILFGLTAFLTSIEIKDLDLWLHLAMGRFILHNGYVPAVDVLSCSIAGKPWVNHEWLFQILAYFIFHNWGGDGLIMMQTVVVVLSFLILFFICYSKDKQFVTVFLLLLVLLVYQARFTIRPDIFSLLFFAFYIYILSLHLDKRWSIYALLATQILWSNFHGFFFMGPLIILLGIVNEFVKRRIKLPFEWNDAPRLSDEEYTRLKQIFPVVILACLINPLTFEGALYPIKVMLQLPGKSKVFFENIQELQRPISPGKLFSTEEFPHYKLLIYLSLMSFILNVRRLDIGVFIFWLIFLFFSLAARRNIVFFSFVAYLVCMTNTAFVRFKDISPIQFLNEKFKSINGVLMKLLLCLWMINYGAGLSDQGYYDFDKYERKSEFWGISQRNFPTKAADFLVKNKIRGNFYNDFNSGAYLLGRCFPNIKVFMDGRTEVYGADFFKRYQKIWKTTDPKLVDEAIDRYKLTGAFLNSIQSPIPKDTLNYFFKKKEWVVVYFDYDAVIFLKNIPKNKKIIDRFRIDLSKWQVKPADLKRLAAVRVTPFQQINRAFTLEALGFEDAALNEAQDALKVSPAVAEPYKIMGKVYGKRGDHEKAFENFRLATMIDPNNTEVRTDFALAYEKTGDLKGAIKQYQKIIVSNPQSPKGYFQLARAFALDKQYENSIKTLNQAHRLDKTDVMDLLKIGDMIYDQQDFNVAREVYLMALTTNKDLSNLHNKLGLCYQVLGEKKVAQKEFEKGLTVNPQHK